MKIARINEEIEVIKYNGENANEIKEFIKNITGKDIVFGTHGESLTIELNELDEFEGKLTRINKGNYLIFDIDNDPVIKNIRIVRDIDLRKYVVINTTYSRMEG